MRRVRFRASLGGQLAVRIMGCLGALFLVTATSGYSRQVFTDCSSFPSSREALLGAAVEASDTDARLRAIERIRLCLSKEDIAWMLPQLRAAHADDLTYRGDVCYLALDFESPPVGAPEELAYVRSKLYEGCSTPGLCSWAAKRLADLGRVEDLEESPCLRSVLESGPDGRLLRPKAIAAAAGVTGVYRVLTEVEPSEDPALAAWAVRWLVSRGGEDGVRLVQSFVLTQADVHGALLEAGDRTARIEWSRRFGLALREGVNALHERNALPSEYRARSRGYRPYRRSDAGSHGYGLGGD